jgi:protein tyrosine/serine phosphatase
MSWLPLQGAANGRDLGGLPLAGGGVTRPGVLLRTDNLQGLTDADVRLLVDELSVRIVVDLRTGVEVQAEGPGPLTREAAVDIRHRSLYPEAGHNTDVDVLPWNTFDRVGHVDESPAVRAYLNYLRHRPDSIVAALRDVAYADGAAIVHCAAGKDRTGVVCALALAIAGVPREAIVADYVATDERIDAIVARLAASATYASDIHVEQTDRHRPRAETMERVLELLDAHDDGPAGWLDAHGFSADDAQRLRARFRDAR